MFTSIDVVVISTELVMVFGLLGVVRVISVDVIFRSAILMMAFVSVSSSDNVPVGWALNTTSNLY